MKIALIGYGKMGKAIERIALERGHEVVLKITRDTANQLTPIMLKKADVAIEFTGPSSAAQHVRLCLQAGVPVICGSTGWLGELEELKGLAVSTGKGAMLQSTNFSVGVQLFFELSRRLALLMSDQPEYDISITETHHTEKKDAPSGTAITLAEELLELVPRKSGWALNNINVNAAVPIFSIRKDAVPGTHNVRYHSPIDDIEIIHTAHNREGFAKGALLAAEFLKGKTGVFSMQDVLGFK